MKKKELYEMWRVHEEILSSQDAWILELKNRVELLERNQMMKCVRCQERK